MGKFIVLEGGEGTGKTSISNKLIEDLANEGYDILHTREPGGVIISEKIRDVILDNNNIKMEARTEALLYAAARRQHLVEKIIPALNEDKLVICDRFIHSSLAYQGYARGIGIKEVYDMNMFAVKEYMPDLVIYLDIDPKIGLARINGRERLKDRLDNEKIEFHKKVREGYLKLIEKDKKTIKKVDASKPFEEVYKDVYKLIIKKIKK